MNLHEYQSKALFTQYGIPVPDGIAAHSPQEAVSAAKTLGGDGWVVKAQVHSGGRGKAGMRTTYGLGPGPPKVNGSAVKRRYSRSLKVVPVGYKVVLSMKQGYCVMAP
jgi:hypothetical protein